MSLKSQKRQRHLVFWSWPLFITTSDETVKCIPLRQPRGEWWHFKSECGIYCEPCMAFFVFSCARVKVHVLTAVKSDLNLLLVCDSCLIYFLTSVNSTSHVDIFVSDSKSDIYQILYINMPHVSVVKATVQERRFDPSLDPHFLHDCAKRSGSKTRSAPCVAACTFRVCVNGWVQRCKALWVLLRHVKVLYKLSPFTVITIYLLESDHFLNCQVTLRQQASPFCACTQHRRQESFTLNETWEWKCYIITCFWKNSK